MRNAKKVVNFMINMEIDFPIILSGNNNAIALEDIYCGGFLVDSFLNEYSNITINDSAYLSLLLYRSVRYRLKNAVSMTEHGGELIRKGFGRDIDIALEKNVTDIIPVYHKGVIHLIPV